MSIYDSSFRTMNMKTNVKNRKILIKGHSDENNEINSPLHSQKTNDKNKKLESPSEKNLFKNEESSPDSLKRINSITKAQKEHGKKKDVIEN